MDQEQRSKLAAGVGEPCYRMVIKGCEALSWLVKECPLPVAGKGSGQIVFYETVTGHIKHWAKNGPFKFESATVFEGEGTAPLSTLTAVEVGDFQAIPSRATDTFLLFAATISWADAMPVVLDEPSLTFVDVAVKDLSGGALDWAVGAAEGLQLALTPPNYGDGVSLVYIVGTDPLYRPSTDWSHGGPLIDKHQVSLHCPQTTDDVWAAWIITNKGEVVQAGDTASIAACRAVVAAKLGDIVKVPACLVMP